MAALEVEGTWGATCLKEARCPASRRTLVPVVGLQWPCRDPPPSAALGWFLLEISLHKENWRSQSFLARGRNADLGSLCVSRRTD